MSCPYYEDFTRGCIEKFNWINEFSTFKTCESENYIEECILYHTMISDFNCKHINVCNESIAKQEPEFLELLANNKKIAKYAIDMCKSYCLSPENSKKCARYSYFSQGKIPSVEITADGKGINLKQIL